MFAIVQDGLIGGDHRRGRADRFAGAKVAHPARMRAAGDEQPQAMTSLEAVRRCPQIDLQMQAVTIAAFDAAMMLRLFHLRFGLHAQQAVADIERSSIGLHVAQAAKEIGVRQGRSGEEFQTDGADHVQIALERRRGVRQHVAAGFQPPVVLYRPLRQIDQRPAEIGRGIGGIVAIAIGPLTIRRRIDRQAALSSRR